MASVHPDFRKAFCKRLVFRAVKHLARGALGLVTADRFGEDGLESLKDLRVFDEVATFPVYRPLLTLDEDGVNKQLAHLGLPILPGRETAERASQAGFSDAFVMKLQDLEKRVEAEQIAQRIAANVTKVPIETPGS